MPTQPRRPCTYSPWCNEPPTHRGLCATHAQQRNTETHPNADFYNSPEWQTARIHVLTLEPNCRRCGATATDVDHIIAIEDGGPLLDPTNHQPLCHACHSAKTWAENHARAQAGG